VIRQDVRQWTVQILVGEVDGDTYAEAALCDDRGRRARGRARSRGWEAACAPAAASPAELAVAAALDELRRQLQPDLPRVA
jgi:hypothetical protein